MHFFKVWEKLNVSKREKLKFGVERMDVRNYTV